jgi:hypothetical protein
MCNNSVIGSTITATQGINIMAAKSNRTPKIVLPSSGKLADLIGKKVVDHSTGNQGEIYAVNDNVCDEYPLIVKLYDFKNRWYTEAYTKDGYGYVYPDDNYITLVDEQQPANDSDLTISELDRQIEWIMHTTGVTRNRAIKSIMGE